MASDDAAEVDYRGSSHGLLEKTLLLPDSLSAPAKKYGSAEEAFDAALSRVLVGPFHLVLVVVCGWAIASDSVEIQCISFVTPQLDSSNTSHHQVRLCPQRELGDARFAVSRRGDMHCDWTSPRRGC